MAPPPPSNATSTPVKKHVTGMMTSPGRSPAKSLPSPSRSSKGGEGGGGGLWSSGSVEGAAQRSSKSESRRLLSEGGGGEGEDSEELAQDLRSAHAAAKSLGPGGRV